ncbi:MAG: hypothetical protein HY912_12970 [Desulfomonile tiedjei]|uniref:PIN domain-containing protein n=1 Tax=Desulfomonile tiedjei TaxID=2358 RepID=A0A9D6V1L7_9BACT|nr:hypothetical protein [Desulfomonile tiedjei]
MTFAHTYLDRLLLKHRTKGALIDTNILLLLFVGRYDRALVPKFKRTKIFTDDDYSLAEKIVSFFARVVTTPNILTEVSNLSNQLPEQIKQKYFREFVSVVDLLEEEYVASATACGHHYFPRCGLTDSTIMALAQKNYLVITDDFALSNILHGLNIDVINFNHLRTPFLLGR